ncbi:hypothetical protein [Maribacter sp. 2304DJ31-5]|uniref:hypothetical protein n=1 Tax=Maribacter sp. 2304DJ31-5 TaxID=3386273 RepID=UPI0039BC96D2
MKKVASIFAVALMALGLTTYVIENTAHEFDDLNELSNMIACGDCDSKVDEREDPWG